MINNEYMFEFHEVALFNRWNGGNFDGITDIEGQNDKERGILEMEMNFFKPLGDDS